MSELSEPPEYRDPPTVTVPHFFITHAIWYDPLRSERGIGISGIYSHLEPEDGQRFPFVFESVFVYFQLSGDAGDYKIRVRLVKIELDANNETVEVQIGKGGEPREFVPRTIRPFQISGFNYCEEFSFRIGSFGIRESGLYEFQLFLEGFEEPLARERILAREYRDDEPFRESSDEF